MQPGDSERIKFPDKILFEFQKRIGSFSLYVFRRYAAFSERMAVCFLAPSAFFLPIMSSLKSLIFQAFSNLLPHINRAKSDEQS